LYEANGHEHATGRSADVISGYAALFVAPDERNNACRAAHFYFHVPSWIAMFTAFFIAVIGNITI